MFLSNTASENILGFAAQATIAAALFVYVWEFIRPPRRKK